MTRYAPLWQQAGNYTAQVDRQLVAALWPSGGAVGATPFPTANTMLMNYPAGWCAVPLSGNNGTALCRWDANEQVTIGAAPGAGTSRIDLVVCQVRDNALDAGANNDFWFVVVPGVPAASPVPPATPANAYVMTAVTVPASVANLNTATITDRRSAGLAVPLGAAEYNLAADTDVTSTTFTNVLSGTFRPAGTAVRVDLTCTGFIVGATSQRTQFQVTNGTTSKLLAAPSTPSNAGATFAGGSALFTGLTAGTLYTFTVQVAVTTGTTWRMRCATQPTLENMRLILANA